MSIHINNVGLFERNHMHGGAVSLRPNISASYMKARAHFAPAGT